MLELRPPLEAQLIDLVDEIAYNTADLDDAFEARLLDVTQIRDGVPAFAEAYEQVEQRHPRGRTKLKFNEALKGVLDRLATDLIDHTRARIRDSGVRSAEDVRHRASRLAGFSETETRMNAQLKTFLYAQVYDSDAIVEEREASVRALEELFTFYLGEPSRMPKFYAEQAQKEPPHRVVCDYIAGMTDHFLLRQHRECVGAGL